MSAWESLSDPQWAGESQTEPKSARMSKNDSDKVSQRLSKMNQRELGSQVTCPQLIIQDNEREIVSCEPKKNEADPAVYPDLGDAGS